MNYKILIKENIEEIIEKNLPDTIIHNNVKYTLLYTIYKIDNNFALFIDYYNVNFESIFVTDITININDEKIIYDNNEYKELDDVLNKIKYRLNDDFDEIVKTYTIPLNQSLKNN